MDLAINEGRKNLSVPHLVESVILNHEGELSFTGSLSVKTGRFTGRSPDDKFIVKDDITLNSVDWGKINHPISEENFEKIYENVIRREKCAGNFGEREFFAACSHLRISWR